MTIRLRTAATVAAVAVIGIGVGGVAYADSGSGKSAPASSRSTVAAARHPILRRMLHGQFVLRTRVGDVTVDLQQGHVTAVSSTSITVKSSDGVSDTYVVTPQTKVRSRGKVLAESAIATGDHVYVVALDASGTATARAIRGVTGGSNGS
jgi:hypothetical protein